MDAGLEGKYSCACPPPVLYILYVTLLTTFKLSIAIMSNAEQLCMNIISRRPNLI